jgi:hypothetical protein
LDTGAGNALQMIATGENVTALVYRQAVLGIALFVLGVAAFIGSVALRKKGW